MDASTRFLTADINPVLQHALRKGVFATRNSLMFRQHIHPSMLRYFRLEQQPPCYLASFYETQSGFVVIKNDLFVRRAIVDPWVACAFSPRCLCPSENGTDCQQFLPCRQRGGDGWFWCHRFDQSALAMILVSLFERRMTSIVLQRDPWFDFKRGTRVKYFPDY